MSVDNSISSRLALITGGSRGIGRAIAIHLAKAGCPFIAINYNENEEAAKETLKQLEFAGKNVKCRAYRADVGESKQVEELFKQIKTDFALPVSILVNNAGIGSSRELSEVTEDDFDSMIKSNLKSSFLCTQAAFKGMEEQGWGRIVFVSSVAAYVGGITGPHYAASKAGQIGLTNSYASRLGYKGITSNCVAPALIQTDLIEQLANKMGGKEKLKEKIPVGRLGTCDEVAAAVLSLVQNGYINGQTLMIDGGMHFK
jgi:3-oxoacyl-[acyl-carrier protein] reductase